MVWKPHVTVAAVVFRDGKFLLVEEETDAGLAFNQPAGHLEENEALLDAVVREALEETAYHFKPTHLVGIYNWRNEAKDITYLRFAFGGEIVGHDAERTLDDGIIAHAGLSEVSVAEIEAARKVFPVATVQNRYNLTDRASEDVLAHCEANGIGFIPWFPLASGKLAQPGGLVDRIAKAHGATAGQVALAWLLARSPVMLPIPGTSSVAHLDENVAAAGLKLTSAEMAELDAA